MEQVGKNPYKTDFRRSAVDIQKLPEGQTHEGFISSLTRQVCGEYRFLDLPISPQSGSRIRHQPNGNGSSPSPSREEYRVFLREHARLSRAERRVSSFLGELSLSWRSIGRDRVAALTSISFLLDSLPESLFSPLGKALRQMNWKECGSLVSIHLAHLRWAPRFARALATGFLASDRTRATTPRPMREEERRSIAEALPEPLLASEIERDARETRRETTRESGSLPRFLGEAPSPSGGRARSFPSSP